MPFYRNLLLVDDDADDREIFIAALQHLSVPVDCATAVNGRDAIEQLLAGRVKPDLIFLDLNMPLMNGKQFLAERMAHECIRDIPVIMLTTSGDSQSKWESRALGASDFITKPDKFSELEKILKRIIEPGCS